MEVNPSHPIVPDLERMIGSRGKGTDVDVGADGDDEAKDFAMLVYDVASLTSEYDTVHAR